MGVFTKKTFCFILITLTLYTLSLPVNSHPGRTDAHGGHYVDTPGWGYSVGSYHYHNGDSVTEVVNGVPQIDVTLRVIPSKLYPGDSAVVEVDVPYRFRNELEIFSSKKNIAEVNDEQLEALAPGITTIVAYINDDSSDVCGVEVFPFPEEIITLKCSEKFIFVGKPFTIEYNVDYKVQEKAPSWNREPNLRWYGANIDICDNDYSNIEIVCKTRGELLLEVYGEYGGYTTCKFKVYGIEDIFLWFAVIILFLILLVTSSLLMVHKHKNSRNIPLQEE